MENILQREHLILTSVCDAQGKLSIPGTFDICMDMAAIHAAKLGVGYYEMLENRCYWVAVRTRLRFYERPRLGDRITAATWPAAPGLAKVERFYELKRGEQLLAEGRTEWGVQDIDTGGVRRTKSYPYPFSMEHRTERVCAEPFRLFRDADGEGREPLCEYTVRSSDIDLGQHMNNVAYVRMLLSTFSTAELARNDISEAEIFYRHACFEGERLRILRWREEAAWRFQVLRPDGVTAVQALFLTREA